MNMSRYMLVLNLKTATKLYQNLRAKTSLTKFSSARLLIAEYNAAQALLSEILKELRLSKRSLKVLIQQMKELEGGLSETEKRALRDLAEQAGARAVYIVNRTNTMTDEEIQDFLKLKSRDFQDPV